jgi:hypothetical protein
MTMNPAQEREIREILVAANSSDATPEQLARIDELIRTTPDAANYAARVLDQQAALAWHGAGGDRSQEEQRTLAPASPASSSVDSFAAEATRSRSHGGRRYASTFAAIAGFLAGVAVAWQFWSARAPLQGSGADLAVAPQATPAAYQAQFVRSTACRWDPSSSGSPAVGSHLTSGESLHLLEGLAEFDLQWPQGARATLSLEGPAAMMLTTEGMPTLRFGRVTAAITGGQRPFVMETPVGRLEIAEYGSIGVSAFGDDAEIHVFDGAATLESAWIGAERRDASRITIESGQAVRIQTDGNGETVIQRHPAERSYFVTQMSMASDALVVPPAYVNAVKAARPVGYWRMEHDAWPRIPNEMGSRYGCLVEGALGRSGHAGNQSVEFGVTDSGGDIVCPEALDDAIDDSYSLEVWVKPSHYHLGAVASLIGAPETPTGVIPHGVLLELGGGGLMPTAVHHPGRIRFLHRFPASNDSQRGTSCYSMAAYTLRKWQHLVAEKTGSQMRLYINGELAGQCADDGDVPTGLRLLVGRLYPARQVRPFKGQLDELALYDRALGPEEIMQHYRLIRPGAATAPAQPAAAVEAAPLPTEI